MVRYFKFHPCFSYQLNLFIYLFISKGDTTLPRRTMVHPPISPSDPLSLSSRVNHLSGRPQAVSPPAFNSLYKPRNSSHFATHHSRTMSSHPVTSPTNNLSRSSLPEEPDTEQSVSDIRSRTWTEPPKNLRSQEVKITQCRRKIIILREAERSTPNTARRAWGHFSPGIFPYSLSISNSLRWAQGPAADVVIRFTGHLVILVQRVFLLLELQQ